MKLPLILASLLALTACGGKPAVSPDMVRANARAAVSVAKTAYVLVANACLDVSTITGNGAVATTCANALDPAYNMIVDAAAAVTRLEWLLLAVDIGLVAGLLAAWRLP